MFHIWDIYALRAIDACRRHDGSIASCLLWSAVRRPHARDRAPEVLSMPRPMRVDHPTGGTTLRLTVRIRQPTGGTALWAPPTGLWPAGGTALRAALAYGQHPPDVGYRPDIWLTAGRQDPASLDVSPASDTIYSI